MKHPNEGFIRSFLGKDKAYKEQLLAEEKKQRVNEYFVRKKNKQNVLTEQDKKFITRTIDVVYSNSKKQPLLEQKNSQDWQVVQTQYGIFYYNEKTKEWMNNFGVIKPSLNDFISILDYDTLEGDRNYEEPPPPPENLQISNISDDGFFTLTWIDNTNEASFIIYTTNPKGIL